MTIRRLTVRAGVVGLFLLAALLLNFNLQYLPYLFSSNTLQAETVTALVLTALVNLSGIIGAIGVWYGTAWGEAAVFGFLFFHAFQQLHSWILFDSITNLILLGMLTATISAMVLDKRRMGHASLAFALMLGVFLVTDIMLV